MRKWSQFYGNFGVKNESQMDGEIEYNVNNPSDEGKQVQVSTTRIGKP